MHTSFAEDGRDIIVSSIKVPNQSVQELPSYLPDMPPAMRLAFQHLHSFSSRLRNIQATECTKLSFGRDGDVISRDSNVDAREEMMHDDIRRFRWFGRAR